MASGFAKCRIGDVAPTALVAIPRAVPPAVGFAQAIERNLPPAPKQHEPTIATPKLAPADQDATPIGPALSGIVVLGGSDAVVASPRAGVDVSRAPRLADDVPALARFLGRPLSRKLISEIEAEIARHYRQAGFPFVNLTTPEQDITAGVLQVRALEFRLGSKSAPGAGDRTAAYILSRVRVSAGQPIDVGLLAQDLDWLGRYPYRRTEAQFSPGGSTGLTDLALQTTTTKPWSAYLGYANSGSPLTGTDRWFAGVQTAVPGLRDAVASYQYTGSGDAVFDDDQVFHSAIAPSYVSDAGRLVIPTFSRVRTSKPASTTCAPTSWCRPSSPRTPWWRRAPPTAAPSPISGRRCPARRRSGSRRSTTIPAPCSTAWRSRRSASTSSR